MTTLARTSSATFVWCLLATAVCAGENLVVDASFESPLPAWFAERAGTSYYAGKEQVADAAAALAHGAQGANLHGAFHHGGAHGVGNGEQIMA